MNRPALKRLSVVPVMAMDVKRDPVAAEVYSETDVRLACEALYKSALRLQAIPRLSEVADYRAAELERYEAAKKIMREALQ